MSRRGRDRKARRQWLFWGPLRQGMQDSADTTRFFGGGAMLLTLDAQGTGATVSDAGSIEHAHCSIVFGASFLRIERGPLPTTQCAESRWEESLALPSCRFALHAPTAGDRRKCLSWGGNFSELSYIESPHFAVWYDLFSDKRRVLNTRCDETAG